MAPIVERMTIAKTETTMHDQALRADTTGFILTVVDSLGLRRIGKGLCAIVKAIVRAIGSERRVSYAKEH